MPGVDINGPKIRGDIKRPGIDIHGPKIESGVDIRGPRIPGIGVRAKNWRRY